MNFAGIAQRERPGPTPQIDASRKDAGATPAPRSAVVSAERKTSGPADGLAHDARDYLTAIARGLQSDPQSRERGRSDGRMGAPWHCPDHFNLLDYSLGYADGIAERSCCGGDQAQPETRQ